jgi:hypothetical protein
MKKVTGHIAGKSPHRVIPTTTEEESVRIRRESVFASDMKIIGRCEILTLKRIYPHSQRFLTYVSMIYFCIIMFVKQIQDTLFSTILHSVHTTASPFHSIYLGRGCFAYFQPRATPPAGGLPWAKIFEPFRLPVIVPLYQNFPGIVIGMTKLKNKILFIIGVIFLIHFTSCSLFFEPEETDISQIETFEQLIDATNGVYGQFQAAITKRNYLFLNFNCDDLFIPSSSINGCIYGGNPMLDENYVYAALFKVVASINNIFEQFDIYGENDSVKREIFGELLFLRAYCYFRLVRSYGQIPIIDDPYINYTVSKSSFTEIYEFIEYDLFKAIQFLPDNNKHCRFPFETPHRGVAKAMLAEVYLSWAGFPAKDRSKYELAAEMAREVIDSSSFFGFNLLPDFADLWKESGRYNQETVFSIYAENSSFYTGSCFSKPISENFHIGYDFTTDNEILINGLNMRTEVNFYNSYPRSYRKDITFFNFIFEPKSSSKTYPATDSDYVYIDKVDLCSRIYYRKFYLDTALILNNRETSDSYFGRYFNIYIIQGSPCIYLFRYAHTLLTYAEAAARSDNLDDKAYECINKIRRRANIVDINSPSAFDLQPGLSVEAFADSVVAERGWELAGEHEGRWFDLLRLERTTRIKNGTGKYMEDNFFFRKYENIENFLIPIPERDFNLNPNLNN